MRKSTVCYKRKALELIPPFRMTRPKISSNFTCCSDFSAAGPALPVARVSGMSFIYTLLVGSVLLYPVVSIQPNFRYIVTVNETYYIQHDFDLHLTTARDFFAGCDIYNSFDIFKRYGYFIYALADTSSSRCEISQHPQHIHIEEVRSYGNSALSPYDPQRKNSALPEDRIFREATSCFMLDNHNSSNSSFVTVQYISFQWIVNNYRTGCIHTWIAKRET